MYKIKVMKSSEYQKMFWFNKEKLKGDISSIFFIDDFSKKAQKLLAKLK
jgi:hypothetical protein